MNKWQQDRLINLAQIKRSILKVREKGLDLDKEKLISQCCMEWGSSRRTVVEMVNIVLSSLN